MENTELGDKLSEADGLITDLQRYIELKENELALLQEQVVIAAVEAEEDAIVADEEIVTEAMEEEGVAVEEAEEEVMAEEEEVQADSEMEMAAEEVQPSTTTGIINQVMGIIDLLKNNIMMMASAAGGLLVIVLLVLFAMRRRGRAETIEISPDDFPDFEEAADVTEEPDVGSEDITDIKAETEQPAARIRS